MPHAQHQSPASVHLHEFQAIAEDPNNAQTEIYSQLDNSDLLKLIISTNFSTFKIEEELMHLGWREVHSNHGSEVFSWKQEWLSKLKDLQLLPAFYVYIKHLSRT